jgi:Holliday junction resolvasome RuvABC DNA-binding subunit
MDPQQIMAMYQRMQQQQQAPQQMATQQFQAFGSTVKALEGLGFDKETLKQVIDAMA